VILMLELLTVDFDLLPAQLLCAAKEHLRVEYDRDDGYIKGAISRAIGEVESVTDITVNPSTYEWEPIFCRGQRLPVQIPKVPVRNLFILDVDGNQEQVLFNVYENTAFLPDTYYGTKQKYLIEAGFSDLSQMAPVVANAIFMITGTLYENRESLQFGSMNELPDMARRLLSGLWRPAC